MQGVCNGVGMVLHLRGRFRAVWSVLQGRYLISMDLIRAALKSEITNGLHGVSAIAWGIRSWGIRASMRLSIIYRRNCSLCARLTTSGAYASVCSFPSNRLTTARAYLWLLGYRTQGGRIVGGLDQLLAA